MFSFALARSCGDRSRSAMKCAQPTRAPEKGVHGDVGVADPGARSRSRTGSGW